MMARVAYVSADFGVPVFGTKGCSIHAQEVLAAMLRQGAAIDLFSTSAQGQPPSGLEGLRLHPLPRPETKDPAAREQAGLAENALLQAELEQAGRFDLIYERYSLWSYAAMEYARQACIPGLIEVNAPLIDEQAQYRVLVDRAAAEQVAQRAFAAASTIIAVSDEVAAWVAGFDSAATKVRVIPNGVSVSRFPETIVPALPGSGKFTVGFLGTLKAWHGVDVLIEAFHRLNAKDSATRLLIVGDGPERDRLQAEVITRGLQAATVFTGPVSASEVPGLLGSMDAAVAPYPLLERFYFSPLKVYEYMAAARPVVASAIGQLRKVIKSGKNGLLVPPGDAAALAAALWSLKSDPALRARLGRNARALVLKSHTWDAVVARVFALAEDWRRRREPPEPGEAAVSRTAPARP